MAQEVKTVEFPFDSRLTQLATATTLASAAEHTFTAITVGLPESTRTIRAAWVEVVHNDAQTTAAGLDGVRIGVQIDAVAFNDGTDLTGTGITNTGDHFESFMTRDFTSYFVTNYTTTSHTVGLRVRFETSAASNVNNISAKLFITYEYDDESTTHVKTVKIPLEGITGTINTTANTNIRGSAGAAQIPNLDTFLPETSKTYRQIWFEIRATDAGAAVTDFNMNVAIDSGTNARATLEKALNSSTRYYDIWVQNSMTTNATHDFQAWSSLTAMFARLHVTLCVTYEFNASTSTTILNSILVPINQSKGLLNGTATADQDVFDTEFWIEEPTTITMVQSAVYLSFNVTAAANTTVSVQGLEKAGGSQGTTSSLYTVANYTAQSGSESIQHRIDLAHGGTAVTLARGRNKLRLKVFAAASGSINSFSGYYIINYTSGKSAQGVGKHNHTVQWPLCTQYDGTIAGTATREVATTNQRTPNLPQTTYWLNNVFYTLEYNTSNSVGYTVIQAERLAGEGAADGWDVIDCLPFQGDGEYGHYTYITQCACPKFNRSPNETGKLNIETARKYRLHGGTGTLQSHLKIITTYHSLVFVASGDISNSAGGSIDIDLHSDVTGERIATTSRSGNGSYSFNVYDSTENLYVVARESGTLLGRSDLGLAV